MLRLVGDCAEENITWIGVGVVADRLIVLSEEYDPGGCWETGGKDSRNKTCA